jgi:hypothetical protein
LTTLTRLSTSWLSSGTATRSGEEDGVETGPLGGAHEAEHRGQVHARVGARVGVAPRREILARRLEEGIEMQLTGHRALPADSSERDFSGGARWGCVPRCRDGAAARRAGQAEILAERAARVLGRQQAALLQDRHHVVDEVLGRARQIREADVEAVGGLGAEPGFDVVGDLLGRAGDDGAAGHAQRELADRQLIPAGQLQQQLAAGLAAVGGRDLGHRAVQRVGAQVEVADVVLDEAAGHIVVHERVEFGDPGPRLGLGGGH